MKNEKKITIIIIIITIIIVTSSIIFLIINNKKYKEKLIKENIYKEISNSYNKIVTSKNNAKLYTLKDNTYAIIGELGNNNVITLKDMKISYETEYFALEEFDYYISYKDVTPETNTKIKNERYKSYVVFNENIITNNPTNFYNEDGSLYMKLNESYTFPIIIKDTNRYGIEFNNELFYINKEDVASIKAASNTKEKIRNNIRTFLYHTVYNKKNEKCTNYYVCHTIEQFTEHMKYIHDNGYLTLTMEELEMFLDGKIRIPQKTIVMTLDDGRRLYNSVPIVEKYQINSTFFVITSLKNNKLNDYLGKTTYANFESHTNDMHHNWRCQGGTQGSQLLCEKKENIIEDLKTSRSILGGTSNYFSYPFYDYNDKLVNIIKDMGFHLAFVGVADTDGYSTPKTDKMKIRRYTVWGNVSLSELKKLLP